MMRTLTVIAVTLLTLAQSQPARADSNYLGTGQWPSSSLDYYFYGSDFTYESPTQAAATDWNNMSDISLVATAQGAENIGVFTGAFGSTNFNGRAVICMGSQGCGGPYNSTYTYVEVDFNTDTTGSWTWGKRRSLANHELGHAFSLDHVPTCDPDHIMYTPVTSSCNVNAQTPQPHDIAAVNARY